MYTGIIKHLGRVAQINKTEGLHSFTFDCPQGFLDLVEIGASIAINGVCLTVTSFTEKEFTADAMQETLRCTNLGKLKIGQQIHLERSAKAGVEVGGHILSGHVDSCAKLVKIETPANNYVLTFEVEESLRHYIFEKGYIGIDGASLTISNLDKSRGRFSVWLIPETLRQTHFSELKVDDQVNIEIDRNTQVLVDTIRNTLLELRSI